MSISKFYIFAVAASIGLAIVLAAIFVADKPQPAIGLDPEHENFVEPPLMLKNVSVDSAQALEALFSELNYSWPVSEHDAIPAIAVVKMPEDMGSILNVRLKKSLFFRTMLPLIVAENEGLMAARMKVQELFAKPVDEVTDAEWQWLGTIGELYRVYGLLDDPARQAKLLRRLDIIPPELVLAQAANESAWGSSRFTKLANNLFGQWTYTESLGIVPLDRPEGATYAVRKFASVDASVRGYLYNLNTNPAYKKLRLLREQMRQQGQVLDASVMAGGLLAYSARGEEYIEELRSMMRSNKLTPILQGLALRPGVPEIKPEAVESLEAEQAPPPS